MPLPRARTRREAALYRSLHPCECGEWQVDELPADTSSTENGTVRRERYLCCRCAQLREFVFGVPDDPGHGPEPTYGGDQPSELLDPGEWLWVAARDAGRAMSWGDEDRRGAAGLRAPRWHRAVRWPARGRLQRGSDAGRPWWESAAAAVDEALKFASPGDEHGPDDTVVSDLGRAARHAGSHAGTDPLGRAALQHRARCYRAGRCVGDEFVMPEFAIWRSGDLARSLLIRSLMDRLNRVRDTGDVSTIRSPEALLEIESLCGPRATLDLLGTYICGLVSWERYLYAPGDLGLDDLVRAMALMTVVHERLPRYDLPDDEQLEIPDELLVVIRAGAADG